MKKDRNKQSAPAGKAGGKNGKVFDANLFAAEAVKSLKAYVPGEQPSGGGWVKLNTNEFPYPPSPRVAEAIIAELKGGRDANLRLYPNPESRALRRAVAEHFGLEEKNAIIGNGSDDILNLAVRAFADKNLRIGAMRLSYSLYPVLANIQGAKYEEFDFGKNFSIPTRRICESGVNIFFLTSPNAPTAHGYEISEVEKLLKSFKGLVLIDEAYAPFSKAGSAACLVKKYKNAIVVCTMSKGWALAGMRVGWALADESAIGVLDKVRDSYNVDRLAQAAALAAIKDKSYYRRLCAKIVSTRAATEKFFDKIGFGYVPSSANFILVRPAANGKSGADVAADLFGHLKSEKILVRYFASDPLVNDSLRVTVGTPEEMEKFKESVKRWIGSQK